MSMDPAIVAPDNPFQSVICLLRRPDIRSVPVVENGRLIGIVPNQDVRQVAPASRFFAMKTRSAAIRKGRCDGSDDRRSDDDRTRCAASGSGEGTRNLWHQFYAGRGRRRLVVMLSVTDVLRVFVEQNEGLAA